jgi:hypothetical protein
MAPTTCCSARAQVVPLEVVRLAFRNNVIQRSRKAEIGAVIRSRRRARPLTIAILARTVRFLAAVTNVIGPTRIPGIGVDRGCRIV